ncbi:unnamed protein product [Orchesella dallaii]|uniref:Uncharacterized protein n=1 Tax=Orchesella dallaii TaxID=48710 RepID=A0ABP1RJB6_9HEXA
MNSKLPETVTKAYFGFFAYIAAFPYQFDWSRVKTNGERLKHFPTGIPQYFWRLCNIYLFIYLFHQIWILPEELPKYVKQDQIEMLILHIMWIVLTICCNCFQFAIGLKHEEFPKQFNETLAFAWKMERYFHTDEFQKRRRSRNIVFTCLAVLICESCISSTAVTWYVRRGNFLALNIFPNYMLWKYEEQIWPTVLVVGFEEFVIILQWGTLSLILYIIAVHLQTVNSTMDLIIQ